MITRRHLCQLVVVLLCLALYAFSAALPAPAAPGKRGRYAPTRASAKKSRSGHVVSRGLSVRKGKKGGRPTANDDEDEREVTRSRYSRGATEARMNRTGKFGLRDAADPTEGGREEGSAAMSPAPRSLAPDQIEVIEYGSSKFNGEARVVNRQPSRPPAETSSQVPLLSTSPRRIVLDIEPKRVAEIQQALAQKGFYTGEATGVYDEATIDAMRRFQASSRLDITGYPTAHALKRLGLTNW